MPKPEQSLCLACGLCCKGVVLSGVRLTEQERTSAVYKHLPVIDTKRGPAFPLPCAKFANGSCLIYSDRPLACRHYRCKLLAGVASGSLESHEAQRRIDELLLFVDKLDKLVTKMPRGEFYRLAAHAADPETPLPLRSQLLTAMGSAGPLWQTLRSLLDEWINSPEELLQRVDAIDDASTPTASDRAGPVLNEGSPAVRRS